MPIFTLQECASQEASVVGGKAYWLGKMLLSGENVPAGICIPTAYFLEYVSSLPEYGEICAMLRQVQESQVYGRRNLSKIRRIVAGGRADGALIREVKQALEAQGISLTKRVAVRSSAVSEDSSSMVFAGVYTSYLDIDSEEALNQAIVGVWASQFSESALFYQTDCFSQGIAVVVQQQQSGEMFGVMFTRSPLASDTLLIEAGSQTNSIVEGQEPTGTVSVSRTDHRFDTAPDPAYAEMFSQVAETGFRLEERFNMFCDVEWAYSDGKVWILQCRPLADTVCSDFDWMVFSQDNTEICSNIYLGTCQNMYQRYLGKQRVFRKAVIDAGYSLYRQYYTIIRRGCIGDAVIAEIERCLDGANYLIMEFSWELPAVMCRLSEVREKLEAYEQAHNAPYLYCRIGEIIAAELSGYSSVTENGGVFVEYVPGRLTALIHGFNLPAQLVMRNGEAVYSELPSAETIEIIDRETGKKRRVPYGKQYPYLTPQQEAELADFTVKMAGLLPNVRLEWYYCGGKLYGKDLSIEDGALRYSGDTRFLSAGTCTGTAFRIDMETLKMLDDLAQKYDISLYQHSKKELELTEDAQMETLIAQIVACPDAILLAERPSIGLLGLAAYVKGMIFEKGAVLSHVGIFLREQHIPAVIDPESYRRLRTGQRIAVLPDAAVVLDKRDKAQLSKETCAEIDSLIAQYNKDGKLLGLAVQGGHARGTANADSDLDLVVLFRREADAAAFPKGELRGEKHDIEIRYISLDRLTVEKMEPKVRYIYANELLAYYDPEMELCRIITKAQLTREEQMREIVYGIRKMETFGLVAAEPALSRLKGFCIHNSTDYWIKRGDTVSAHMWLSRSNERLAQIIFALNGLHMPSSKWRYHIMMTLPWIPDGLRENWELANCYRDFGEERFGVRVQAYQKLLTACVLRADSLGLLPEDFSAYYVKTMKRSSDNTD